MFFRTWMRFRLWRFFRPFLSKREPKAWLFMGGCYNSGTTILREILGSHPEIASLPREGVNLTDVFPDLEQHGWVRMWHRNAELANLNQHSSHSIADTAMRDWSLWWQRGASVFLEKSIIHGAWMPALQKGFNNARFIGVIRNGYCVCEGIRRRAQPTGHARASLQSDTYPLMEIGQQWVFANKTLQRDQATLEHYMEVRYEDLVRDPLTCIQNIFKFVGVDPSAATQTKEGSIDIDSKTFEIRDQNPESLKRLSNEDYDELDQTIGTMMTELDYNDHGAKT